MSGSMTRLLAAGTVAALLAACGDDGENEAADDGSPPASEGGEPEAAAGSEGGEPEGYNASTEYLQQVIDHTLEADSYRWESTSEAVGGEDPIVTQGEVEGDVSYRFVIDARPAEFIETGDGVEYIRSRLVMDMPEDVLGVAQMTSSLELKALTAETDGWYTRDMSGELGDELFSDDSSLTDYADLVAGAESVEELAPQEIDGETMVGIAAEVPQGDIMGAGGIDTDVLEDLPELEELDIEPDLDQTQMVEVWIDSEGYLRRISLPGEVIDISDFGEPLDIEVPTEAVDLTDRRDLFEQLDIEWAILQEDDIIVVPNDD